MNDRKRVGDEGEEAALEFLLEKGMVLMERNWRHRHLEVDLIMLDGDGIHIVEVKTRTGPVLVKPEVSVNIRKRRLLVKAASAFIAGHGIVSDTHFDVVSVILTHDGPEIEFFPDAFTLLD